MSRTENPEEAENQWVSVPKQRRTRARLERIYAVAEALFEAQGFENTTLRQVAAGVPCSMGTIYDRFEGKDALLLAMHERLRLRLLQALPMLVPSERLRHLDLSRWLQLAVQGACASITGHLGLRRAVMERCIGSEVVAQKERAYREELCGYFVRGLSLYADDIRHPDPALAAQHIYSMLTAVISQRYDMRLEPPSGRLNDPDFLEECTRMCMGYLVHAP